MIFSKHNIFAGIRDSQNYFIINPLSRNADILCPEKAEEIINRRYTNIEEYREKGYLAEEEEEKKLYRARYLDFLAARESSEVRIFFVPGYSCNFSCSYCYQNEYHREDPPLAKKLIDALYAYLEQELAGKRMYITIFGGEPLLPAASAKSSIDYLVRKAAERGLPLAVVTNGYHLSDYIEVLKQGRTREIQVTLDGTESVHNKRRPLKNGGETFARIAAGIDRALESGLAVNPRVVVDRENLNDLPELARFAVQEGWTGHPLFKTQLGRNYELHTCQANSKILYSRISLDEDLYRLIRKNPEFLEFHKPAYSVSSFLFENGELPEPLFDSCPGCKTEWAFDCTGRIYSCTATVCKVGESLGTFYPETVKKQNLMDEW